MGLDAQFCRQQKSVCVRTFSALEIAQAHIRAVSSPYPTATYGIFRNRFW